MLLCLDLICDVLGFLCLFNAFFLFLGDVCVIEGKIRSGYSVFGGTLFVWLVG